MGNIIYAKLDPNLAAVYGQYEHPIKMMIESESNVYRKNNKLVDLLYNVEKSSNYSESTTAQTDFDIFSVSLEGQGAENDSISQGFTKTIFHHQFMKEFTITAEMMEDSKMGIAPEMKRRATKFVDAYEKTRTKLAAAALYNGTSGEMTFGKGKFDLTTSDGLPLFHNAHKFKKYKSTQSNNFYVTINSNDYSVDDVESALNVGSATMRSFRDENGDPLGYTPNVIVLPGNRFKFETWVKKVCGTEQATGGSKNDINIQYGNWTIVVVPEWTAANDTFILTSTEANKQLFASAFFDRTKLTVTPWVDNHTGNFVWTGRARMGIGHNTWKHAAMITFSSSAVTNASQMTLT